MTLTEIENRFQGLKELLERAKYGKVITCEYSHDRVLIKLEGDSLDGSLKQISNLLTLINNYLPEFPKVGSCRSYVGTFKLSLHE